MLSQKSIVPAAKTQPSVVVIVSHYAARQPVTLVARIHASYVKLIPTVKLALLSPSSVPSKFRFPSIFPFTCCELVMLPTDVARDYCWCYLSFGGQCLLGFPMSARQPENWTRHLLNYLDRLESG